jgi:hypothetical protein
MRTPWPSREAGSLINRSVIVHQSRFWHPRIGCTACCFCPRRQNWPAQPVDATPSNALIRQCFPGRTHLFGCTRSKLGQGSVPADLTLVSDLAFVFNASWVRAECCVDPLRPPDKSGVSRMFRRRNTPSGGGQCECVTSET